MQQECDIEKIIEKTEGEIRLSERDQSLEQARRSMEQLRLSKPAPTYTERVATRKPATAFTEAYPLSLPRRVSQQTSYIRDSVPERQNNDDVDETQTMSHFQRLAGFKKPTFFCIPSIFLAFQEIMKKSPTKSVKSPTKSVKSPTKSIKSPSKPSPVNPSSTQGQTTGPNSYLSGFHRLQGFTLCS